jgi:hypothetical protein
MAHFAQHKWHSSHEKNEAPKRSPWPRLIKIGRITVKIYDRKMPSGN